MYTKLVTITALALFGLEAVSAASTRGVGLEQTLDKRGNTRLGAACKHTYDCMSDDFCNDQKFCDQRAVQGVRCTKNVGCISNNCVDNICRAEVYNQHPLGQRCTASNQCQSGYCGYNVCREPKADGVKCYKNAGCQSGRCIKDVCTRDATA